MFWTLVIFFFATLFLIFGLAILKNRGAQEFWMTCFGISVLLYLIGFFLIRPHLAPYL